MTPDPCSVCGGKDLKLIDGFYYCVECGTQDVNAQETLVEHSMRADGTYAHVARRKVTLKNAITMSREWHKWHAYNFILVGLVDELMNLGASSGFRDKALWIWTRYMKEFMDKDQMGTITEIKEKEGKIHEKSLFESDDESDKSSINQSDNEDENDDDTCKERETQREKDKKKREQELARAKRDRNSIRIVTRKLLLSIMYVALNLDRSDIQLSHLLRFIREGRLSLYNTNKFLPSELDLNCMPLNECRSLYVRERAMALIRVLDLGKPLVPNLSKMVENYVKDLCLPKDFKNLVFSLMHQAPCDHLNVNYNFAKQNSPRTPDFEGVVMSYVLVALKMTFGLDDHYERRLSETVEKINEEENRLKSYKLGRYSESTDRLFSFNEWSRYLQFRKILLCKHYLPMAQQNNLDIDDRVFIEHVEERKTYKKVLSDEITMDILDKIETTDEGTVIPKSEFITTLTPLADFTEIILYYIQDPDVKLLISEDFTQYSLKYACEELKLSNGEENIITGVSKENKTINKLIVGGLTNKENDHSLVFVRHCENRNWLKTKPPTIEHIFKIDEIVSGRDSDLGCDSHSGNFVELNDSNADAEDAMDENEESKEFETIEEEREGVSIFDDQFNNIEDFDKEDKAEAGYSDLQFNNESDNLENVENEENGINDECNMTEVKFDLETFDRRKVIKELVLTACKKYRIPVPSEYDDTGPKKRKSAVISDEAGESVPKKKKVHTKDKQNEITVVQKNKKVNARNELNEIMAAYYANMEKELLENVSAHLNSFVKDYIDPEKSKEDDDTPNENKEDGDKVSENCEEENRHNDDTPDQNNDHGDKVQSCTNNNNDDQNSDLNQSADCSVVEVDNEADNETNNLFKPKVDPDFDEKTHDIKQLYVKYSQNICCEDLIDDDEEIDKILEKKIEECKFNETIKLCAKDLKTKMEDERSDDSTDSEDEEADAYLKAVLQQKGLTFEPLIKNQEELGKFKYWQRHYVSVFLVKQRSSTEKFDLELNENFPKSFVFVMKECAAILDCSAFSLYKHLQNLEQILLK